jgi:hypothetical protein
MIYTDLLIIVVPPPFLIDPLTKILMPFTLISWICISSVILTACITVIILKFTPKKFHDYIVGKNVKGSILNVWNLLLGGSQTKLPTATFPRFLLAKFLIFALVMRSLYQGAIFNLLKDDISTIELSTIDEFIEHKFTFIVYESLAARSQGSKFMDRHLVVKLTEMTKYELNTLDPNYKGVTFGYLSIVLFKNKKTRGNFTLRLCKEAMLTNQIVFYFTQNFYLVDEINRLIEEIKAAGLVDYAISKYINMRSSNEKNEKQTPSPLNFDHLKAVFEILIFGLLIALFCFVAETLLTLLYKINLKIF